MDLRKKEAPRRGVTEVAALVADLDHAKAVRREAAIARLRVIGRRGCAPLAGVITSGASSRARAGALTAIEGLDDRAALTAATGALSDPDAAVAMAAIGVLRGWLSGDAGTAVLDALASVALDTIRESSVRLAALDALSELPRDVVQPLRQRVTGVDASEVALDDPLAPREWLASHPDAPLSSLHTLVGSLRDRERREASARVRQDWLVARGAVHAVLARRDSRVALYDLRESFDAAQGPLPLDFLAAMAMIGDASCLEPLARSWSASPADAWWRDRLQDAARDIMTREHLTARHTAVKRIRTKFPGFLPDSSERRVRR